MFFENVSYFWILVQFRNDFFWFHILIRNYQIDKIISPRMPARQRMRTATPSTQYFMLSIHQTLSWLTSPSPLQKMSSFHFSGLLTLEDKAPIHQRWHSRPPRESWASRTDWTCRQKCWSLFYTIPLSWRLSVNTLSVIKTSEFLSAAKLLFRKCSFHGNVQRRICGRSQLFFDITPIDVENDKNDSHQTFQYESFRKLCTYESWKFQQNHFETSQLRVEANIKEDISFVISEVACQIISFLAWL